MGRKSQTCFAVHELAKNNVQDAMRFAVDNFSRQGQAKDEAGGQPRPRRTPRRADESIGRAKRSSRISYYGGSRPAAWLR
jgi:hypothetical protein